MKLTNLKLIGNINPIWTVILSSPIFMVVLFMVRFNPQSQFAVLSLAALTYLLAAIAHHFKEKTLTLEIVIEYVLIVVLVLILLQSLFF